MQLWRSEFSPFIRRAQTRYCSKLIVVPLPVFHRMAESIFNPQGDLIFVINAGRSGSTLVMKVSDYWRQELSFGRGPSGKALVGSLRGQSPPETKPVCRHCLQILTTETIKVFENFAQFTSWFFTSMFQGGAEQRHFFWGGGGLAHPWPL